MTPLAISPEKLSIFRYENERTDISIKELAGNR
jgi:hypothetical protein